MLQAYIKQSLAEICKAEKLDDAIKKSRFLGELLWKNSTGQYELSELENTLVEKFGSQFVPLATSTVSCEYVHILTKAYDSGGHTRIVERLINAASMQQSAILITETAQANALKKLSHAKFGCIKLPKSRDSKDKIQRLVNALAHYKTVILHIHPYDIETVLAVALAKKYYGLRVMLYNHADHVFSYGFSVADRVLEISYFGWGLRAKRKTENKSVFVGIPIKLPELPQNHRCGKSMNEAYIAAAGTAYKFRPACGYSFPEFVDDLSERIKTRFVLIGPQPVFNWWWWKSYFKTSSKLDFYSTMPHEKYLQFLTHATAFIDSFPMTGGTAFSEIFSMGIPCFGVLTGAHGYTPADQLKSQSTGQLIEDVKLFLQTGKLDETLQEKVTRQLYEAHDVTAVANRIVHAYDIDLKDQQPFWVNPAAVDTTFYEKIWIMKPGFSMPVHVPPVFKLLYLFVRHWTKRCSEQMKLA
ncbi:hypothetical protein LPB67_12540 [Undibacterium sp. Jales W-56]|uniref:hypothetical protein n=1 Tax=Undibacterium sp. Jales W-56 TaxID=2897325 RepID=UPI0021CF7618|nr:hypothetical protein [Undibacterium sp. Jales W-56]MCU6434600.1 hypothetical protein [Undibacterium sp. Jales W-56]